VDTRERLIEATQELLWERGYVGTSPGAVLRRSGVGQGSLYHHFSGKPALALAAVERSAAELTATAESFFSAAGTALERIEAWLRRDRDVLRGCPIGRLTQDPEVVADAALRAPVEQTLSRLQGSLAEVVRQGQQAGELDPSPEPSEIAAAVVAVLQGGYVLSRAAASSRPFDQAVSGVLVLLRGLQVAGR
jgi:AcrR family transcriptional regulator